MAHIIDPKVLEDIVKDVVAEKLNVKDSMQAIRNKLADQYPSHISKQERCWLGSRAGGILGKMTFMHGSMSEYLIFFGTPAATTGFSGRYNFVEIWDFFFAGQTRCCDLETDQISPDIYRAGDKGYLSKGEARSFDFEAGSWMLEYGRGPLFTALPFALMDSLLSSVELKSFWLTIKEYSYFVIKNLRPKAS